MIWSEFWQGFQNDVFTLFVDGQWISGIIVALIYIIIGLVNLVLTPINWIISAFVPDLDQFLSSINDLFIHAATYLGWSFSLVGIPSDVIVVVTLYYTLILTTSIALWAIKLALLWKKALGR